MDTHYLIRETKKKFCMGNASSKRDGSVILASEIHANEPRVSNRLLTEVSDGSIWVNLVRNSHDSVEVDFSASNVAVNAYAINALYKPDLTPERLPQGHRMLFLFPEQR